VTIHPEIQSGHLPRLEWIVKVSKKAKPVILANAAFFEPLTDRAPLDCRFPASWEADVSKVVIEQEGEFRRALVDEPMRIRVERRDAGCDREAERRDKKAAYTSMVTLQRS
jgi:hypothetical protein